VKKVRLWELLVERALFDDPRTAKAWIMAGKVIVEGQRVDKAGHFVSNDASIRIKGLTKYVGRGGLKLEGALADFGMDVSGQVALDVGAATGGFTDCLLQHEVAKVYAVDVGYGLLAGKLRADQRVVNMERTNISVLSPDQL
jgi:23S rRNA (cytidine1920-2'-O)/16S rRNA (cytidine1409-2'-O)-methyltransferase